MFLPVTAVAAMTVGFYEHGFLHQLLKLIICRGETMPNTGIKERAREREVELEVIFTKQTLPPSVNNPGPSVRFWLKIETGGNR